jgi:zinc protease
MEDLDAASLDDVAGFFATYYTPDNAVLTVAGDFDPDAVRAQIAELFGPIPRGPGKPPLPDMTLPPTFGTWLRETVEDDVPLPRLFLALRLPAAGTPAWYPASVLAAVLGLRRGSRLVRHLVREQQLASEASAFTYDLTKGSDLLVLDVTARPGVDIDTLETAVAAELDALIADGVREDEVARALALLETDLLGALQRAQDRADRLSQSVTYFEDPTRLDTELDRYRAVTAEAVTATARALAGPDNRASLRYVPRAAAGTAA